MLLADAARHICQVFQLNFISALFAGQGQKLHVHVLTCCIWQIISGVQRLLWPVIKITEVNVWYDILWKVLVSRAQQMVD